MTSESKSKLAMLVVSAAAAATLTFGSPAREAQARCIVGSWTPGPYCGSYCSQPTGQSVCFIANSDDGDYFCDPEGSWGCSWW